MQAVKDAGILVVLVVLATTVRITPIEPVDDAGTSLLATPAHAATAETEAQPVSLDEAAALAEAAIEAMPFPAGLSDADVRPFVTDAVVQRCAQIVVEFKRDRDHPEQYVVVVEKEEGKTALSCRV
jgi:hypothetical protein